MSKISRINEEFKKVFSNINEISAHTAYNVARKRQEQANNLKRDLDNKITYGDLDTLYEILDGTLKNIDKLQDKTNKDNRIGNKKYYKEFVQAKMSK